MGSEQSSQNTNEGSRASQLRRGKSVPNRERIPEDTPPRSTSPGPSICSDSDLPYISYTVNQPIGDSPKITNKQSQSLPSRNIGTTELARKKSNFSIKKPVTGKTTHNIIVVKPAVSEIDADRDADLVKLRNIPMFLPIMRGTLNLPPGVRDPEILERLDPVGLFNLCVRYQHHLNINAQMIANEQNLLCVDIDAEVDKLLTHAVDRQKQLCKFMENLNKVHELSRQLTKCHMQLNQTLESLETLNNLLPIQDRLEPFVWTTG